jgi:hypothetical protein
MRASVRSVVTALSVACLAGLSGLSLTGGALAQNQTAPAQATTLLPPLKQLALTDKHIEGVIAAANDMDAITWKLPENAKSDPKVIAQLDAVAKKFGLASYDEYNNVFDNISVVLAGFDPMSKKYVGTKAVIKAQIAQVQTDKNMSPKDKKDTLAVLNQELNAPELPIDNKGNIDLVAKYYDKLFAVMSDDSDLTEKQYD